jgi:Domain of unknown function (DUF4397)
MSLCYFKHLSVSIVLIIKFYKNMKKIILTAVAFATVFASTLVSCKKDKKEETPAPAPVVVETFAKVLVTHASPNAPGVDLLVDNTKVNPAALTFPNSTAAYLQVKSGSRNIKVNVAGTSTSVINANVPFTENKNYSLFAIDSVSKISALLIEDDLTAPAAGKAHVRFIHLSPDAPAVDVAVTGGAVVFGNKSFKGDTPFTPLASGTYNLEVRVAGTTPPTNPAVLLLPNITLTAGKIYTVFAKGFLNGTGPQALGAQIIVNN